MLYQSNSRGKRNSINKSIASSISSNQQLPWIGTQRQKYNRSKTQSHENLNGSDSLQQFQNQLHSMMKSIKSKRQNRKKRLLPSVHTLQTSKQSTKSQVQEIRSQISELKKVIEKQSSSSNRQQFRIQDKLQKIIINLQNQRQLLKMQTQKAIRLRQISTYSPQQTPQFQPIYIPQPQMFYPPTSYYQTPYYSNRTNRQKYKKLKNSPESQQSEEQEQVLIPKKKNTAQLFTKRKLEKPKLNKTKTPKKTRLRIFFLTVAYAIFLRSEARKSAIARRKNLQTSCKQQFFKHLGNLKNWILGAQKFAFSILLQKKNLNFVYFDDESNKLRTQKQNLIMKIILLGINSLLKNIKPQKINIFVEVLANLCLHRSFPINSFWTEYQMNQVCVSQTYGFFKIDSNLQKFLICLLIFVKIFIFNMLLQPHKFDIQKFPKNEQPMTKNLKIISSVYYLMLKQLLFQYLNEPRDIKFFKMGNYAQAKFAKVKCSQPLIYGKVKKEENQYISGLFTQDQLEQLKNHADWKECTNNLREIIDKIHQEAVKYKKFINKRKK